MPVDEPIPVAGQAVRSVGEPAVATPPWAAGPTAGRSDAETAGRGRRWGRRWGLAASLVVALLLLFGVPWAVLVLAGWPAPVMIIGSVLFAAGAVVFPPLMVVGHGPPGRDWAARTGDTMLGVVWVLFAWSVPGGAVRLGLLAGGVGGATSGRTVAGVVVAVALVLLPWGVWEATRLPRVRRVEVTLPRLGTGLDGTRVVVLADTHYGPIDRTRWSRRVAARVTTLEPHIVCHAGDIADGTPARRRGQVAPLGTLTAPLAKVYVTGNHEYFTEAQGWLDHMAGLGWQPLHNRHLLVERGGDRLVLAGVDDRTAASSAVPGHRCDIDAALADADPDLPVLLLAHQPAQLVHAVRRGVDLQISGHTHGGQIWPFHYLVRLDQPVVQGLTRHGERTQLYTSRGTGFWGPPLRIFAPSEITMLVLRSPGARPATG